MSKRPVVIALVVVALTVSAVVLYVRAESTTSRFCTTGLAIGTVNGGMVALEDQGGPGRDGCDDRHVAPSLGYNVLGFDCKIRDPADVVVAVTTPNRSDGTCGQVPIPPGGPVSSSGETEPP
jgi:hypothetical protein